MLLNREFSGKIFFKSPAFSGCFSKKDRLVFKFMQFIAELKNISD